jgi:hypothetical protein
MSELILERIYCLSNGVHGGLFFVAAKTELCLRLDSIRRGEGYDPSWISETGEATPWMRSADHDACPRRGIPSPAVASRCTVVHPA